MYYAVRKGHKTGVFDNWSEAQSATAGFPGPDFKKFRTKEEAEAYLENRDVWADKVAADNKNGFLVAFTDGSYDKNQSRYSYGVCLILPDGTETGICAYGSNKEYIDSNNIIGEIFGVINALDWAISNGYEKIKIYHDYEGLSKWTSGEWAAKSKVSKMFVELYKSKFEDFLQIEFVKVPGHSNISYNDKADQLAKSALTDKKRVAVQGENWFSISHFNQDDFDAFTSIIEESDNNITHTVNNMADRVIYKFSLNSDSVTVTLFSSGKRKLLVQGKNTYLFQVIITTIVELEDESKVEQILGNAYRMSIRSDDIDSAYAPIDRSLPDDYPAGNKRLIKQSIVNLKYYLDSEDYSQYVFPALRALEGHIKYLLTAAGRTAKRNFDCFNLDKSNTPQKYIVSAPLTDATKKDSIENCYNYYKSQRDTIFHFGDILGPVDNTRFITSKDEANEIINKCIELICTQQ